MPNYVKLKSKHTLLRNKHLETKFEQKVSTKSLKKFLQKVPDRDSKGILDL